MSFERAILRTGIGVLAVSWVALGCASESGPRPEAEVVLGTHSAGPATISRSLTEGGPNPTPAVVQVSNGGNCTLNLTSRATTVDGGSWFSIAPATGILGPTASRNGDTGGGTTVGGGTRGTTGTRTRSNTLTATISFNIQTPQLRPGTYTGSALFEATCSNNGRRAIGSPKVVSINLTIEPSAGQLLTDRSTVAVDVVTVSGQTQIVDLLAAPRRYHRAVWTGYEMVVWGGAGAGQTRLNSGFRYEPVTGNYVPMSTAGAPEGRTTHGMVFAGNSILVFGGNGDTTSFMADGASYDLATDSWSPIGDMPGSGGVDFAVWTGAEVLAWQGSLRRFSNGQWSSASSVNAPAFGSKRAVWTGDELIVVGNGRVVSHYDPSTDTWTPGQTFSDTNPDNISFANLIWTGRYAVLYGGANGSTAWNGGLVYDPRTRTGSIFVPPGVRAGHRSVWTGDRMLSFGGHTLSISGSPYFSGVRVLGGFETFSGPTPTQFPCPSAFCTDLPVDDVTIGVVSGTAIWTGTSLIVYGGRTESGAVSGKALIFN